MNSLSLRSGTVEIAGDITIDWNLAHIPGIQANSKTWTADATTRAFNQRGGAALLADLIGAVATEMRKTQRCDYTLCSEFTVDDSISPTDKRFNHSYALLQPVPSGDKWPDGKPKLVWRISQFLGVDRVSAPQLANPKSDVDQCRSLAEIVVLDDAALGFRDHSSSWPVSITNPQPTTWVVLKCARPVVRGALWEHLTRHFAERLIVIMAVEDLRDSEVQISNQLSWERTAQDLFWELTYNPRVNGASSCAHTVVSFGTSGAFLLSRRTEPHETIEDNDLASLSGRLFFDPEVRESGWEGDRPGNMLGNTTVLTAAIVRQLMIRPGAPDISKGIQTGIAGMRRLFRDGFGKYSPLSAEVQIDFPLRAVAAELAAEPNALANASIQDPARKLKGTNTRTQTQIAEGYWTILEDSHRQSLNALAEQIVVFGLKKSLNGVPIGSYGALQTVDRREIEALNSIQNLIGEYCGQPPTRPLSIAVFGPPGSGKSFGVEQVAKSVRPGRIEIRTFNLSQFAGPEDLLGALHQVRDISLRGKLPLVFWDEFDTTLHQSRLGWLRFFLSPMQDGNFQEGQVTHPIGSCIFVFAGGTSHHFAGFGATLGKEEFKAVKGPDFVSRLKGFLNVLGPNCQSTADGHDPYFIIRRAILLRSIFERNSKQLFQQEHGTSRLAIDSGLLRAFLRIGEYRHGARSIESIIAMSSLAARSCFEMGGNWVSRKVI